ncbi:KAP family P-loop NTPase fold protein [Actinomyces vulturis]|uniref:KAP family P-loop NTPase fold protein n=1 Tax=Actinomyces vulturis TaxID=1857645 RepID=UPI00082C2D49|nr:P-loop NTPase fold protein [Actinomyces vulturis]
MSKQLQPLSMTDIPANEDSLNISQYVDALADFSTKCETPMTIAIQGDWGSGKTSLMNMIKNKISNTEQKNHVIWFNTWQYSQFNMGDKLILALLQQLTIALSKINPSDKVNYTKKFKKIAKIALGAGTGFISGLTTLTPYQPLIEKTFEGGKKAFETSSEELNDYATQLFEYDVKILEELKSDIALMINSALKRSDQPASQSDEKIFIFIDDLDRLEPAKAVELLESLKLFLDLPGCVFILAIDFEVIKQGVHKKFGNDFREKKAQSFFDKIIQVPFHMPVSAYETGTLIKEMVDTTDSSESKIYQTLCTLSVGNNPRSIKRLLNTFRLLENIRSRTDKETNPAERLQLFAILCLQSAYPLYYREFIQKVENEVCDSSVEEFFKKEISLFEQDNEETSTLLDSFDISAIETYSFINFLTSLLGVFTTGNSKNQMSNINDLRTALSLASITSVGNDRKKTTKGEIVLGFEVTIDTLLTKYHANPELVSLFSDLFNSLKDRLGDLSNEFTTGIGVQPEPKFYRLNSAGKTTKAELSFNKSAIVVKFARRAMGETLVKSWIDKLAPFGEDLTDKTYQTSNLQINVSLTPENYAIPEAKDALLSCLEELFAL